VIIFLLLSIFGLLFYSLQTHIKSFNNEKYRRIDYDNDNDDCYKLID